ncbi:MAG: NUDIX domain-containing protein [Alphaproteobacteria bacterium]
MADNNWMVSGDERETVAQRAVALGITGTPDKAAHNLGPITLGNGKTVTAHVVHAVDPVITDGVEAVLIKRKNPPGQGLPALPGGFMDPVKGGGVESAVQAAAREAMEEVGVKLSGGTLIGQRNMNRPYDVRTATIDLPQYGIAKDDIFMVSTQAVKFDVPDLRQTKLVAGDDAEPGSAGHFPIATLTRDTMGIADHYDMIVAAMRAPAPHVPGNRVATSQLAPGT